MAVIEVRGRGGESLLFDGASVAKFRHEGKEEVVRNPASTFREVRVKAKKRRGDAEQEHEALLAWAAIKSLTVSESEKASLERLVAALEAGRGAV